MQVWPCFQTDVLDLLIKLAGIFSFINSALLNEFYRTILKNFKKKQRSLKNPLLLRQLRGSLGFLVQPR